MPARTTPKMLRNLSATKKLFSRVEAFVLMELHRFIKAMIKTDSSLWDMLAAWSVTPAAEKMLSTNTMLRMARVAGMMASTQVHAARNPETSP